jgi:hypothetical protein
MRKTKLTVVVFDCYDIDPKTHETFWIVVPYGFPFSSTVVLIDQVDSPTMMCLLLLVGEIVSGIVSIGIDVQRNSVKHWCFLMSLILDFDEIIVNPRRRPNLFWEDCCSWVDIQNKIEEECLWYRERKE